MRKVILHIIVLALTLGSLEAAFQGYVDNHAPDLQIELSADQDNMDNNNTFDPLCEIHCHNHIASADFAKTHLSGSKSKLFGLLLSESVLSSPVYELKRPPRS